MSKVYCSNCGAEVVLPEKSTLGIGLTISEESKGNYVIRTKENSEMNKKVNVNNSVNNGGNNMNNNFTMEELVATVAAVMGQMNGNQPVQEAVQETEAKTKETGNTTTKGKWGQNSKYYGKVMADGHIFNPYLDRRFLPAQYLNMIKNEFNYSAYTAINSSYSYMYSIEWLVREVDKLAFLEKADKVAFEERRIFLNPINVYNIISDYVRKLNRLIETKLKSRNYRLEKKTGDVYLKFKGYKEIYAGREVEDIENHEVVKKVAKSDDLKNIMRVFIKLSNDLHELARQGIFNNNKGIYKKMNHLLQSVRFIQLPYDTKKSSVFIDRFMAQGAYYTIRNLVLFEGYELKGYKGSEASELLRSYAGLEGYKLHAILKECLDDNA